MSETSLDRAIDVVAREMMALDAPAGMRAEVLARIESAPQPGSALLPRLAMAAGAAVIVLAIAATIWFVSPGGEPESTIAKHDTSSTSATGATQSQPQASGTLDGTGLAKGLAGTPSPSQPSGRVGSVRLAPSVQSARAAVRPDENVTPAPEMGPAALVQPDPIAIADLGPDALHVPAIGVEPLGDLKPITIPDISVGSGEPHNPSIQR